MDYYGKSPEEGYAPFAKKVRVPELSKREISADSLFDRKVEKTQENAGNVLIRRHSRK